VKCGLPVVAEREPERPRERHCAQQLAQANQGPADNSHNVSDEVVIR
jgi:hypothetical protein